MASNSEEYVIVQGACGRYDAFEAIVQGWIDQGYVPAGGLAIKGEYLFQAMWKPRKTSGWLGGPR